MSSGLSVLRYRLPSNNTRKRLSSSFSLRSTKMWSSLNNMNHRCTFISYVRSLTLPNIRNRTHNTTTLVSAPLFIPPRSYRPFSTQPYNTTPTTFSKDEDILANATATLLRTRLASSPTMNTLNRRGTNPSLSPMENTLSSNSNAADTFTSSSVDNDVESRSFPPPSVSPSITTGKGVSILQQLLSASEITSTYPASLTSLLSSSLNRTPSSPPVPLPRHTIQSYLSTLPETVLVPFSKNDTSLSKNTLPSQSSTVALFTNILPPLWRTIDDDTLLSLLTNLDSLQSLRLPYVWSYLYQSNRLLSNPSSVHTSSFISQHHTAPYELIDAYLSACYKAATEYHILTVPLYQSIQHCFRYFWDYSSSSITSSSNNTQSLYPKYPPSTNSTSVTFPPLNNQLYRAYYTRICYRYITLLGIYSHLSLLPSSASPSSSTSIDHQSSSLSSSSSSTIISQIQELLTELIEYRGIWPTRDMVHAIISTCIDNQEYTQALDWYISLNDLGLESDTYTRGLLATILVAAETSGRGPELRAYVREMASEVGLLASIDAVSASEMSEASDGTLVEAAPLQTYINLLTRPVLLSTHEDTPLAAVTDRFHMLDVALNTSLALTSSDPGGRIFRTLWRDDVRATLVKTALPVSEVTAVFRKRTRAAINSVYKSLYSTRSETSGSNRTVGSTSFGMNTINSPNGSGSTVPMVTSPWTAQEIERVNQRALLKLSQGILPRLESLALTTPSVSNTVATNNDSNKELYQLRYLLVQRSIDVIKVMQDMRIDLSDAILGIFIRILIIGNQPEQLRPIITFLLTNPSGTTAQYISDIIYDICLPQYAGTIYRILPELVMIGYRPRTETIQKLLQAGTKAWILRQTVQCPQCLERITLPNHGNGSIETNGKQNRVEEIENNSARQHPSPVLTRTQKYELYQRSLSTQQQQRSSSVASSSSFSTNTDTANERRNPTSIRSFSSQSSINPDNEDTGTDIIDIMQSSSTTKGSPSNHSPKPPIPSKSIFGSVGDPSSSASSSSSPFKISPRSRQRSSFYERLLANDKLLSPIPPAAATAAMMNTAVRCVGRHITTMDSSSLAVFPSKQLSILVSTGLISLVTAKDLRELLYTTCTQMCARETWAVWQIYRNLQFTPYSSSSIDSNGTTSSTTTVLYQDKELLRTLLRTFINGKLELPAWEIYLLLYPRNVGPLPSLRMMEEVLKKTTVTENTKDGDGIGKGLSEPGSRTSSGGTLTTTESVGEDKAYESSAASSSSWNESFAPWTTIGLPSVNNEEKVTPSVSHPEQWTTNHRVIETSSLSMDLIHRYNMTNPTKTVEVVTVSSNDSTTNSNGDNQEYYYYRLKSPLFQIRITNDVWTNMQNKSSSSATSSSSSPSIDELKLIETTVMKTLQLIGKVSTQSSFGIQGMVCTVKDNCYEILREHSVGTDDTTVPTVVRINVYPLLPIRIPSTNTNPTDKKDNPSSTCLLYPDDPYFQRMIEEILEGLVDLYSHGIRILPDKKDEGITKVLPNGKKVTVPRMIGKLTCHRI